MKLAAFFSRNKMIRTLLSLALILFVSCSVATNTPSAIPAQTATDMGAMNAARYRLDPNRTRLIDVSAEGYTLTVEITPEFSLEPYAVQDQVLDDLQAAWVQASGVHDPSEAKVVITGDY